MNLQGRYAVITGAGQGLGAAIASHFVAAGASVMLCARSESSVQAVCDGLASQLCPGQKALARKADVSLPSDVDGLVEAALAAFSHVDILVNNAGVYGPLGPLEDTDWREWVQAMEINVLGTVYPCRALLPHFKSRRYGKIINISGGGATSPLPRISAYAASKAAVVRFTETLAEEVKEFRIDANAIAPGALATRLMEQVLAAGPEKVGVAFHARMTKIYSEGGTPLDTAAKLCAHLGSADSDGLTGKLIAAVWDPWTEFHAHRAELSGTDIYTLRRITPKDRGMTWGKE